VSPARAAKNDRPRTGPEVKPLFSSSVGLMSGLVARRWRSAKAANRTAPAARLAIGIAVQPLAELWMRP
jgi:hypothetical protein